jgi:DNA-binding MarR family transcriptional regulator
MKRDATIETARYICETGKIIHDHILKIQGRYLTSNDDGIVAELSVAQLNAVKILSESGELTMRELADQMAVSPPSASAMVDRLVEKGVFSRERSTQDRRKVVVRISSKAEKIADEIKSNIMQFFIDLVDKIGAETARQWCDVLTCVKSALTEENDARVSNDGSPFFAK